LRSLASRHDEFTSEIKKTLAPIVALIAGCAVGTPAAFATERFFTYSYEPETMPKGAWEVEQWFTLRAGRNSTVGQQDYTKWQFSTEFEYGRDRQLHRQSLRE
jgi:hypothetical protein